jgi:tetratricopeptide (TPR) repeat protein
VARDLCQRSCEVAVEAGADDLAAEASNALAGFALERGDLAEAQARCGNALQLAGENSALIGKIQQNLGIIANIQARWQEALDHYHCSLQAYQASSDQRGCAIAYHNLGMIHADRKQWLDADRHYQASQALAESVGDRHLGGLAALSRAEVRLAQGDHQEAQAGAHQALQIFNEIEARRDKAGAHRLLGMVLGRRGQLALAESHLRSALEIAASASCPLTEADAAKELAALYQAQGHPDSAVELLDRARDLYHKLQAEADLVEVNEQIGRLRSLRSPSHVQDS